MTRMILWNVSPIETANYARSWFLQHEHSRMKPPDKAMKKASVPTEVYIASAGLVKRCVLKRRLSNWNE